jgi:phosphoserine phosphatase
MRKTKNYESEMKKFGSRLYHELDTSILRFVQDHTDERTENILCTASPEDYVKYLAEMLGWAYLSSTLNDSDGTFYHLYGENKITTLKQYYPPRDYTYNLVLSDSESDSDLMKLFQVSYYVKHGVQRQQYSEHR